MSENDELALALARAQREFRIDLCPNVAQRLIGRVSYRYSVGQTFRDSLNAVMNSTDWPDRRRRLAYRKALKQMFGRRGGFAAHKRAA